MTALEQLRAFQDQHAHPLTRQGFIDAWKQMSGGKVPSAYMVDCFGRHVVATVVPLVREMSDDRTTCMHPLVQEMEARGTVYGWPIGESNGTND